MKLSVAAAVILTLGVGGPMQGCSDSCESLPAAQFRVHGVTYVRVPYPASAVVAPSDVGAQVATITAGLPSAATRCHAYTLKDGQGSFPVGTKIFAISGVAPTRGLGIQSGSIVEKYVPDFDASQASASTQPP